MEWSAAKSCHLTRESRLVSDAAHGCYVYYTKSDRLFYRGEIILRDKGEHYTMAFAREHSKGAA